MDNGNFSIGDVVVLKSGGPAMTIEEFGTYSEIRKAKCAWFDGLEKKTDLFSVGAIKKED